MRKTLRALLKNCFSVFLAITMVLGMIPQFTLVAKAWDGSSDLYIRSADDWNAFANAVNNGKSFEGITVQLVDDITVTTMVGDSSHRFKGIFDGNGFTLTFNCIASEAVTAPFRYIQGATIRNLVVDGTIDTAYKQASGVVGCSYGNCFIERCISSITINSSVDSTRESMSEDNVCAHGGFVSAVESGTMIIRDSLFNGSMTGEETKYCGGFVGWLRGYAFFYNCLNNYNRIELSRSDTRSFYYFVCHYNKNEQIMIDNCYYGKLDNYGWQRQGIDGRNYIADQLAAQLGPGWREKDDEAIPVMAIKSLAAARCTMPGFYKYTGSVIPLDYSVIAADGETLQKNTHYIEMLKREGSEVSSVKDKGKYTLTLEAKEESGYTGAKTISFIVDDAQYITSDMSTLTGSEPYHVKGTVTVDRRLMVSGRAELILEKGSKLIAPKGITVESGDKLYISGSGELTINDVDMNIAGIGGGVAQKNAGEINISGGTINVTGGDSAAGIGGGWDGDGGTVVISGGVVVAQGGNKGAGIGGGQAGSGGNVTISGGTIHATGGGDSAEGIGKGGDDNTESGALTVENADFAVYGRSDALTYSEITQVNGVYPRAEYMKIGKKRTLTTVGCSGGGNYLEGDTVTIKAPGNLSDFKKFTTTAGTLEDTLSAGVVKLTIPSSDVTVSLVDVTPGIAFDEGAELTYNGTAQEPEFSVKDGETTLNEHTDYDSVSYSNNKNAGENTASVSISGKGLYCGTVSKTFSIGKKEIELEWGESIFTYDGHSHTPTAVAKGLYAGDTCKVTVNGKETNAGEDYTATATALSNDNYKLPSEGLTRTFVIKPAPAVVIADDKSKKYGEDDPELTATVTGLKGRDTLIYSLFREEGENAGSYKITSAGEATQGNYTVTYVEGTFSIGMLDSVVSNLTAIENLKYTGFAQSLVTEGSVTGGRLYYALTDRTITDAPEFDGNSDSENKKWSTSIPAASDAGTYYVWYKVVGDGNHKGVSVQNIEVEIRKASITPVVSITGWTYGKPASKPGMTKSGNPGNGAVTYKYKVKGAEDNTYSDTVPTNAGEYTIQAIVAETDNYESGTTTADFTISKVVISSAVDIEGWTYGDTANEPTITDGSNPGNGSVTYAYKIKNADDSTYSATVPTAAGNYTVKVTIEETDNYSGSTAVKDFTIGKAAITPTVAITGWTYGTYDENTNKPSVTGNTGNGTETVLYKLKDAADTSYSVTVPTQAGDYTVKADIAESDNYAAGLATADFTITKAKINPTVSISGWTYGGTASTPSVTGNSGSGTVTYEYKKQGEEDTAYATEVPMNAGDYTIRATIAESTNYQAGLATADFTIAKEDDPAIVTKTAMLQNGGKTLDLSKLVSGAKGAVSFDFKDDESKCGCSLAGNILTSSEDEGAAVIKVTIADSDNCNGKTDEITVSIVNKAIEDLTVTQEDVTYGESAVDPSYTEASGAINKTVAYTGTLRKDGSAYASSTAPTEAGSYFVTVNYETDTAIYTGNTSFTIKPLDIGDAVVTPDASELAYTGNTQTINVGKVEIGGRTLADSDYDVTGNTGTNAGSYTVAITAKDSSNYTGTAGAEFTIAKVSLTVTADAKTKKYGEADPGLTYSVTGFVNNETADTLKTGSLTRDAGEDAGTYAIKAGSLSFGDNYSINFTGAAFEITKADGDTTKPEKPILEEKTDTTITVKAVNGYEYSIDNGSHWQSTGKFTGLTADTEYSILTRKAETANIKAGEVSDALTVKTDKETVQKDKTITAPAKGEVFTVSKCEYKITDEEQCTVSIIGTSQKGKLTIGAAVKIAGKSYRITEIGAKAFQNNKNLTKVVIGKNISSIGKQAFYGCKKLKSIVIKTEKLTAKKVGGSAFKKISSKATVSVPKKKKTEYKKLLKKKGLPKSAKVK